MLITDKEGKCFVTCYQHMLITSFKNVLNLVSTYVITRVCHLQAQNGAHLDSIFVIDMHFSLYLVGLDFFENIYLRNIPT